MDELIARLENADRELINLAHRAIERDNSAEKDRLLAKSEGVRLALSYAREMVSA